MTEATAEPTTIAETIERLKAEPVEQPEGKTVTDFDVTERMRLMRRVCGYVPHIAHIEPIRTYLAGKGVALIGETGVGKTFLMQALGARIYLAADIASNGLRGLPQWFEWTDGHALCIDDLGAEHTVNEFGNKAEVMAQVIAHRLERQGGVTHVTSNLSAKQVAGRYGDRTLSRLLGMCTPHTLEGLDMRRVAK